MTTSHLPPETLIAHRAFLQGIARALLRDEFQAEDAVQASMVAALERRPPRLTNLRAWLARVTRNAALQRRRQEARLRRRHEEMPRPPAVSGADEVVGREELRSRVLAAVLALPEPFRSAVLLRYYEELPPRAIARRLGVPVETVRSRLRRGIERLRSELDESFGRREAWGAALTPLAAAPPLRPRFRKLPGAVTAAAATTVVAATVLVVVATRPGAKADTSTSVPVMTSEVRAASLPPATAPEEAGRIVLGNQQPVLAGRVVDEAGHPVPEAQVTIAAPRNPFTGEEAGPVGVAGVGFGRYVPVNEEGRFRVVVVESGPVWVSLAPDIALDKVHPEHDPWVQPPAEDLVLVVRRVPVATLVVRARDLATGRELRDFACLLEGVRHPGTIRTRGATLSGRFRVETALTLTVTLLDGDRPIREAAGRRTVTLAAGERVEVELYRPATGVLTGVVVDRTGLPVPGAVVWPGSQLRARGDEPFQPFDLGRVPEAVRTDATGFFALAGQPDRLSAWHTDLAAATVKVPQAAARTRIVLAPRGSIVGRVLGVGGGPAAGVVVRLDRNRETRTDGDGSFAFDAVLPGVRGLQVEGAWYAVRVEPGATQRVELGGGVARIRLRLLANGEPWLGGFSGLLLPLGPCGPVQELEVGSDGVATLEHVPPGPYLLLGRGRVAPVEITSPVVEADLGDATLVVTASPGRRLFVVPGGSDDFTMLLGHRAGVLQVPAKGEVRFSPIPRGRWLICATDGVESEALATVVVEEQESRVVLPEDS